MNQIERTMISFIKKFATEEILAITLKKDKLENRVGLVIKQCFKYHSGFFDILTKHSKTGKREILNLNKTKEA